MEADLGGGLEGGLQGAPPGPGPEVVGLTAVPRRGQLREQPGETRHCYTLNLRSHDTVTL